MARPWHPIRRTLTTSALTLALIFGVGQARAGAATLPTGPSTQPARLLPIGTDAAVMARLFPKPDPHFDDPVQWASDKLGYDLFEYQEEIARSVAGNEHTAVPSCHGPGKSFLAAVLIAWWVDTRPAGNSFVVWTAPRWPQVKAVIGRYLRPILNQLDAGFTLNDNMELKGPDGALVGFGRKPADHDDQGFSGIHADHVFIVVDEATGVGEAHWVALNSFMSGTGARLLAIGNPDNPTSYFRRTVHDPKLEYVVHRLDALRLPSMTRERVAPFPELVAVFEAEGIPFAPSGVYPDVFLDRIMQPKRVAKWLAEWGTGNPYWSSKVRGEFPAVSEFALFTQDDIDRAHDLTVTPHEHEDGWFAFDIAAEGDDETVGYRGQAGMGGFLVRLEMIGRMQDPMKTAGQIAAILDRFSGTVPAWIDAIGVGDGVHARLREQGYQVTAHRGSNKSRNPKYIRRRVEVYYQLQRLLQDGLIDLDPDDTILAGQLLDIRWKWASDGTQTLETRKERVNRGAPSPDRADAVTILMGAKQGRTDTGRGTALPPPPRPRDPLDTIMTRPL